MLWYEKSSRNTDGVLPIYKWVSGRNDGQKGGGVVRLSQTEACAFFLRRRKVRSECEVMDGTTLGDKNYFQKK